MSEKIESGNKGEKARDREEHTHVRINRKLWCISTLAELFITDSTYANIFSHHASRRNGGKEREREREREREK